MAVLNAPAAELAAVMRKRRMGRLSILATNGNGESLESWIWDAACSIQAKQEEDF